MKNAIIIILTLMLSAFSANAQLYSVTTPFKSIVKTTNHGILHEYILVNNLSGNNLPMRWIARFGGSLETPTPTGWTYGVADPDSAYAVLNNNDSADFILPISNNNKIIITVNHNGNPGAYEIDFTIFPLSNRADSTIIGFPINVTQGGVGVKNYILDLDEAIFPNPSTGVFNITERFEKAVLYNSLGEQIEISISYKIDLSSYPNGVYFLKIENKGNLSSIRLVKI